MDADKAGECHASCVLQERAPIFIAHHTVARAPDLELSRTRLLTWPTSLEMLIRSGPW